MGILNITPDSFYAGSRYDFGGALASAEKMLADGADIIDIGGESTRPGAEPVDAAEEKRRVLPVIERLKRDFGAVVSVDTYKSSVAQAALDLGADMVNDVSAARFDARMPEVLRASASLVVIMHMQGTPRDMQDAPYYDDVVAEVRAFFGQRLEHLEAAGIARWRLILDPGIGFGKRLEDNLALIRSLPELAVDGLPLMLGASRKSMIGKVLAAHPSSRKTQAASLPLPAEERLEGTLAITALAAWHGARIVRVHDVKENVRVVRTVEAVKTGRQTEGFRLESKA